MTRPAAVLAISVGDLTATGSFCGDVLAPVRGRERDHWADWNSHGRQRVSHLHSGSAQAGTSEMGGHDVPIPHSGLLLDAYSLSDLAQ